jgi:hypothetical protein
MSMKWNSFTSSSYQDPNTSTVEDLAVHDWSEDDL